MNCNELKIDYYILHFNQYQYMKTFGLILFFTFFTIAAVAQTEPTDREKEMLKEINYVRTNPQEYVQYVQSYLDHWDSGPSEIAAAKELTKILTKMKPLAPLEYSEELYLAAVKHGAWMLRTKKFSHSDLPYAENLVMGDDQIRFAVLSLLIDDGIPSRGHRKNILDPESKEFGCHEILGSFNDYEFIFIQEFR